MSRLRRPSPEPSTPEAQSKPTPRSGRSRLRPLVLSGISLATVALGMAPIAPASAAVTQVLVDQTFRTADAGAAWTHPVSASNRACLTAGSNPQSSPIPGCGGTADADGSGVLRLTPAVGGVVGTVYNTLAVPMTKGLDVSFNSYIWGRTSGLRADGLSFILAATDPANPAAPASLGPAGAWLGYGPGVSNGYMAFFLDERGNNPSAGGTNCTKGTTGVLDKVLVRGPGNGGNTGYCLMTKSDQSLAIANAPGLYQDVWTRPTPVAVKIAINPSTGPVQTSAGATLNAG